jgi:hypothetical protein
MRPDLYSYFERDHDRLEQLLQRAIAHPGSIDPAPYAEFRKGLLRHIAMEEKVLFPGMAQLPGGGAGKTVEQLRLEHGALVALLVPPPDAGIVATIRSILDRHNALEEANGGVYALSARLSDTEASSLMERIRDIQEVPVVPHNPRPEVLRATQRAVERAGYTLLDY